MRIPLQFSFVGFFNSGPQLAHFSTMNKLVFSNFPVYQLFWSNASASFNVLPLLMTIPLFPFEVLLFIFNSFTLSFSRYLFFFFSHNFFFVPYSLCRFFPHTYPFTLFNPIFMLLAKGKGFSRRKGEAIVDEPLAKGEKGEEAPHSKSNHFEDEEVSFSTWVS